jgi:ABC-type nickel/cobalt efflux system permease component RcnA
VEIYVSLVLAGLSVSFFHAVLPNHWLPFVLAGRAQRWSLGRTLWVTTLAGGGHVLITTLLGVLIVWMGLALSSAVEAWSAPLAAGVLILFGLFYVVRHLRGGGHGHSHFPGGHAHDHGHDHAHDHGHAHPHREGSWAPEAVAVASLVAMLTFSPCEGFLPIYLTAWPYGWGAFAVLSGVLAAGTLSGMLAFTGLTYAGFRRVEMPWMERCEHLVLGGVLILLGVAVLAFQL